MFGQTLFAEIPLADFGRPPYVERGWIKDCADRGQWSKQPAAQNDWAVLDRAQAGWAKQVRNDVNTIGCGYVPSNLGKNK